MRGPLLGRDEFFDFVAEKDDPNLVVVLFRAESQNSGYFNNHLLLKGLLCSELIGGADINEQHHRQFPLFIKDFNVRMVESGGYVPVNIPDIITWLVLPDFRERHTAALEDRMILTREDMVT